MSLGLGGPADMSFRSPTRIGVAMFVLALIAVS
jgi:hypothetical protein